MKFLKGIVVLLVLAHIWFNGYNKGFKVGHFIGASEAFLGFITLDDLLKE